MFDPFAQGLFDDLPDLQGLDSDEARRILSSAYLAIVRLRTRDATTTAGTLISDDVGSDSSDDSDPLQLTSAIDYLRRLADTMEFHAVLGENVEPRVRTAGAFITAESLALLADYHDLVAPSTQPLSCRVRNSGVYTRIESGLLYLIAGYESNAAGVVAGIVEAVDVQRSSGEQGAEWGLDVLINFCRFRLNPLPLQECPVTFEDAPDLDAPALEDDTVGRLYGLLGESVRALMAWLVGDEPGGMEEAEQNIGNLLSALGPSQQNSGDPIEGTGGDYARVRHLAALLNICLPEIRERSLLQLIPTGPGFSPDDFSSYLSNRARGDSEGGSGRPVLWPSARSYVDKCISGDARHAVVSMPTGSGKSFIAELAISQSVGEGWVLYLAPTNALTEQIRFDLRKSLELLGTDVRAFIGGLEYSLLKTDVVADMPTNSVAVMTPEKASLALRLYPHVFQSCKLIVFDECHLLGEESSARGATAELLLSRLMLVAPDARILLMSAVLGNPDDLAGWLNFATGYNSSVVSITWRPTRTLRGALAVSRPALEREYGPARAELAELPPHRKKKEFQAPYTVICNLQGAWQSTDEPDYGLVEIPCEASFAALRAMHNGEWRYKVEPVRWVNGSAVSLAEFLAESGIQTLAFIPASRHYPFLNANNTVLTESCLSTLWEAPAILDACRILAEYEFGVPSVVFELLDKGVAVHTALMIETEKIASEEAFIGRSCQIMYATGTLAQGLNLPASAVVIAGTRIGYERRLSSSVEEQRKRSQLLNAAGRAGRAGFANQGLVVAVPDRPMSVNSHSDVRIVRDRLDYLQHTDNAVNVQSSLETFIDRAASQILDTETASAVELQSIASLTGDNAGQPDPEDVLRKSYATYLRRMKGLPDSSGTAVRHLLQIRNEFVGRGIAPDWVPDAAQKAGLDYFLISALLNSWRTIRPNLGNEVFGWSVLDWTEELLRIAAYVHPTILMRHFNENSFKTLSPELNRLADPYLRGYGTVDWEPNEEWIREWQDIMHLLEPWMTGRPLKDIAAILTSSDADQIDAGRNTAQKPIPKTLLLTNDSFSRLALMAGGLVAIAEQVFEELSRRDQSFSQSLPLTLMAMPLCIKYGSDSVEALAWYRFGIRLRRPAKLLYQAFPPPPLGDDELLQNWVRNQRRLWLNGSVGDSIEILQNNSETVEAIRQFIIRG